MELFSVRGRLLRPDMIKYWKVTHEQGEVDFEYVLELNEDGRTRWHLLKVKVPTCATKIKKNGLHSEVLPCRIDYQLKWCRQEAW